MKHYEANDICQQMVAVRGSLRNDVEEIMDSARTLTDWRHYLRQYPWASVAVAAAAGFLIVPKQVQLISPSAETLAQLAKKNQLIVKSDPSPEVKGGILGAAFSLLANAALRGAMGYVGQNAGKLFHSGGELRGNYAQQNR